MGNNELNIPQPILRAIHEGHMQISRDDKSLGQSKKRVSSIKTLSDKAVIILDKIRDFFKEDGRVLLVPAAVILAFLGTVVVTAKVSKAKDEIMESRYPGYTNWTDTSSGFYYGATPVDEYYGESVQRPDLLEIIDYMIDKERTEEPDISPVIDIPAPEEPERANGGLGR